MAQRVQRKRTKGWRMPEGAVFVGRPTKWGNPFRVGSMTYLTGKKAGQKIDAEGVVAMYRHQLTRECNEEARELIRAELAGRDLACWCSLSDPCHADVLLEIANGATK
ncbi:DUF4326 domain-containing protein [Rhodococcus sp. USK10]|uniref:DUF4326 domain-containing protein n=1 Tax=Rhodococcus sp. USK10 TaxID=2789739 RepID=UPI001C5D866A|nr:DUF4326 domain-containing protein [Rhodococcus sp. USK10]QYB01454.1 DUF4326 domain-containing protein [Rhodococcus sp. USK10]